MNIRKVIDSACFVSVKMGSMKKHVVALHLCDSIIMKKIVSGSLNQQIRATLSRSLWQGRVELKNVGTALVEILAEMMQSWHVCIDANLGILVKRTSRLHVKKRCNFSGGC